MKKPGAAAQFLQPFADENQEENPNVEPNANPNTSEEDGPDFLDRMLKEGQKKNELHLHGLYLHTDISKLLNRLAKQGGRGAKSRIVNDALRKYFTDKGLL